MIESFFPSSYYPEYFKADLELGTSKEFPLSSGLDLCMVRYLLLRSSQSSALSSEDPFGETIRSFLKFFGLILDGLSEDQVRGLFQDRIALFQLRGTFAGLDLLAKNHFEEFKSIRGLPFIKEQLKGTRLEKINLSQSNDEVRWVTYQIPSKVKKEDREVARTFMKNAELFIPNSIKIHVKYGTPPTEKRKTSFTIPIEFQLKARG